MNLIILGSVGSGKGTQAKLLATRFHITHISSGALLRQEVEGHGPKAELIAKFQERGDLVPFETLLDLIDPVILSSKNGFILDGTPRDLRQAEHLDWFLTKNKVAINRVIFLKISDEDSMNRLLKRAQIENRTDDNPETIEHRLQVFRHETIPVVEYYRSKGLVLDIDGTPDINVIHQDIVNRLTIA